MTKRAAALALAACLAGVSFSACLGEADFRCTQHTQCGPGAFCELDSHCSVYDPGCPGQRRYVERAGASSGSCVGAFCRDTRVVSISAGGSHACVARDDGTAWCWGGNDRGQLGDDSRTPRSTAVKVRGLVGATAVAAGRRHSCAVSFGGLVSCWGANDRGQLGDGSNVSSGVPVTVVSAAGVNLTGAIAVAAGGDFSCAVLADGTAQCWGDNSAGQLGDGGATMPGRASVVAGLSGVRSVSAGGRHACAVMESEQLRCWGDGSQGQLGNGSFTNQPLPVLVNLTGVVEVSTGPEHTCAATRVSVNCWGSNAANQLGNPSQGPVAAPVPVDLVMDPIAVGTGARHSCAIQVAAGNVLCWGANDRGQVAGAASSVVLPEPVAGVFRGTALAVGDDFSCVLTEDDAVFCWGDNRQGQLGTGSATIRPRPAVVPGIEGAVLLAAGGAHTCAVTQAGSAPSATRTLACWGANEVGQLGDGETIDRASPAPTRIPELQAASIAAGAASTCAVVSNTDRLACWGDATDRPYPTTVALPDDGQAAANGSGAKRLAMGGGHACLVAMGSPASTLLCFGANDDGQLGDGTLVSRTGPEPATWTANTPPVTVAAGGRHSCAIAGDHEIWCWGRGDEGQLGDGAGIGRTSPVAVPRAGVEGAAAIAAGGAHTCVLTDSGRVTCWGRVLEGQTASAAFNFTPNTVLNLPTATAIATGGVHTCALTMDKLVHCWGANDHGQLGDGTFTTRRFPAAVEGLTDVEEIATGGAHTCARRTDGTVHCWGADTSGQLGDGILLTIRSPTLARLACN